MNKDTSQNIKDPKIILHIPHSSHKIPNYDEFCVDREFLNAEVLKLTDWYTDDLFYSNEDEMIVADFSRIYCDAERFTDDSQEMMAKFGMGVLYTKSDEGLVIRHVTDEMRNSILENYYKVHHQKLSDAVKVQLKAHHKAVIIDCHSFPEIPLERSLVKDVPRPDFNIGTDEFHTPQELMDLAVHFFERKGYSLGIDSPYSGTIVPSEHYKRNNAVQSIMLEVNRRLYLVDKTNEKSSDYSKVKAVTNEFIRLVKNYVVNGI